MRSHAVSMWMDQVACGTRYLYIRCGWSVWSQRDIIPANRWRFAAKWPRKYTKDEARP